MTIPLIVLAVLAVIGGWIGLPEGVLWGNKFGAFLAPTVGEFTPVVHSSLALLTCASVGPALLGIIVAWLFYVRLPGLPFLLAYKLQAAYNVLLEKYYVDQLYNLIVTRPLFWTATFALNRVVDSFVIEGIVNGAGLTVEDGGALTRRVETGNVQQYAFVYVLGVLAIVGYYLYLVTH